MKNKIIKGLILSMTIGLAFTIGKNFDTKENIKVENVLYQSTDSFYIEDGEIGIEFTDGSWASVNQDKDIYVFQPISMGDWSYNFDNLEDFEKCVKTYLEN